MKILEKYLKLKFYLNILKVNFVYKDRKQVIHDITKYENLQSVDDQPEIRPKCTFEKQDELENLKNKIQSSNCCMHLRKSNFVFNRGNPFAKIMIIGEAPGEQEDINKIPFCGESGLLLDEMLKSIDISDNDVYITNIIFWRPEDNRKPTENEINQCLPFVREHISIIDPKFILFIGSTALFSLIPSKNTISQLQGKIIKYKKTELLKTNENDLNNCNALKIINPEYNDGSFNDFTNEIEGVALFHPSFLMRQPSQKKSVWFSLLSVKNKLQKIINDNL